MSFEFKNLGRLGNRISVSIPRDADGLLGRECPATSCAGYFKVKPGTGLTGPDLSCHCPYCGHTALPDHFWTKEQIEYAKSMAIAVISGHDHGGVSVEAPLAKSPMPSART